MKAVGAAQKLRFTVVACSGEDPEYPARELLYHSPQTRGWQSPRFCKYPQEIVLRLERPSKIKQIQILSHEHKIATKIEIFVASTEGAPAAQPKAGEPDASQFQRLGYLSFDSNERSGHQARELKSVHITVTALLVRLVIHRCHVNKLNIYNQVGIVAFNIIGDPLPVVPEGPAPYLQVDANTTGVPSQPYYNRAAAELADVNLDIHVDPTTAMKIRQMAAQKDAAVAREDYDEAKRLKACIERLKVVGQKVAQLEARKRAAVEKEDYDLAKALKADIEKLRMAGDSAATAGDAGGAAGQPRSRNPDDIFNRVLGRHGSSSGGGPAAAGYDAATADGNGYGGGHGGGDVAGGSSGAYPGVTSPPQVTSPTVPSDHNAAYHDPYDDTAGSYGASGNPDPMGGTGGSVRMGTLGSSQHTGAAYHAYDERPAQGRGNYMSTDGAEALAAQPSAVSRRPAAHSAPSDIPAPSGWPADLASPEPLTPANTKDCEAVTELCGEYVARAFCSKTWQLREAALQHVTEAVRGGAGGADKRSLVRLATRALKDKVANVFYSAVPLLQALLDAYASSGAGRELHGAAEQVLPMLIEKLGDNNVRQRDTARDIILHLAGLKEAGLRSMTGHFVRPVKNQSAWRPVLSMLQLLHDLVPQLGIAKPSGGEGFDLQELMEYVGKALDSPNADVRSSAVKVAIAASDIAGPAVRKLLPTELNPKIKAQLDQALGGSNAAEAAAPAAPPPPAAHAEPRKAKASTGGGGGGGGGAKAAAAGTKKGAAAAAAAAAATAAAHSPVAAAHAHHLGHSHVDDEGAAEGLHADDDPAAFLQELRAREKQYGKDHPAVAESCSNLAILYNQRGDYTRALPLYERALRIFESVHGPDHQEVAHTLTDLAVLHLEQGRDEVGRPLLERALAIQTKALGPDHQDVIAIRDVLNSE